MLDILICEKEELKLLEADCAKKKSICENILQQAAELKEKLIQEALDFPNDHIDPPLPEKDLRRHYWLCDTAWGDEATQKVMYESQRGVMGSVLDLLLAHDRKNKCLHRHLMHQFLHLKEEREKANLETQRKELEDKILRIKRIVAGWGNQKTLGLIMPLKPSFLSKLAQLAFYIHRPVFAKMAGVVSDPRRKR